MVGRTHHLCSYALPAPQLLAANDVEHRDALSGAVRGGLVTGFVAEAEVEDDDAVDDRSDDGIDVATVGLPAPDLGAVGRAMRSDQGGIVVGHDEAAV